MIKRSLENLKQRDGVYHEEFQYLTLIEDIINNGTMVNGRNGNALTTFGSAMHFSLENNIVPILTTKNIFS